MSTLHRSAITLFLFGARWACAQDIVSTAVADREWQAILRLSNSVPARTVTPPNAPAQKKAGPAMAPVLARQAAERAREFYLRYPNHAKANDARRIEALTALSGAVDRDLLLQQAATSVAKRFREDQRMPAKDRFDVALKMERTELNRKDKNKDLKNRAAEMEKAADKLKQEFGDSAALQKYYLEAARGADIAKAAEIATNVTRSPAAASEMKAEARAMLARAALVGKAVNVKAPLLDGGQLDLGQRQEKLTVVVVQPPTGTARLEPLGAVDLKTRKNAQFVYLYLGGTAAEANKARAAVKIPGRFCHVPLGPLANGISSALQLNHTPAPYVYVFSKSGTLAACGPLLRIAELMKVSDK